MESFSYFSGFDSRNNVEVEDWLAEVLEERERTMQNRALGEMTPSEGDVVHEDEANRILTQNLIEKEAELEGMIYTEDEEVDEEVDEGVDEEVYEEEELWDEEDGFEPDDYDW